MRSTFTSAVLSALAYSTVTSASAQQQCPKNNDVCFTVAVPEAASSSGSGNLYFQLESPTSYSWIALGTGSQMSGSNMFVMYQDGNGNVTISPRQGTHHIAPTEDTSSTAANLTLLAGSGVDGDTMRANVMCSNCDSWANGGAMSLSSTDSEWIAAWKSGSSLASTDKNEGISQHDAHSSWTIDLTKATVTSDSNPFVSASGNNTSSDNSTDSSSSSGVVDNDSSQDPQRMISAHGVIMSIVFVILYPLGSILMPLLGKWIIHAAWQFVTFILMWIGFGLGYVASQRIFIKFEATHTVFGTVIVCLMVLQPVLGYLHHAYYVKHQKRGLVSYAHIAYGRSLMLLGVVNGGLGLQLAGAGNNLVIAYAVIAAIIGVLYAGVKLFTTFRKRKAGRGGATKGGSNLPGRHDKYSPAGEEVEMPRRPFRE
ncbi:hypothetical protein BJ170DRAFT_439046 [Xylariales sp. AK1849]|nr:hypothetical protein BJ170DRAFT_439046 [Xylariales sp. AK1849]